jgi:hypothetical protein
MRGRRQSAGHWRGRQRNCHEDRADAPGGPGHRLPAGKGSHDAGAVPAVDQCPDQRVQPEEQPGPGADPRDAAVQQIVDGL